LYGVQETERAYLLWKARQVVDSAQDSMVLVGERSLQGEGRRQHVEGATEESRGPAARADDGRPGVSVVAARKGKEAKMRAALLHYAVHALKQGVFEELMELMA
jgi:hypothetical protein